MLQIYLLFANFLAARESGDNLSERMELKWTDTIRLIYMTYVGGHSLAGPGVGEHGPLVPTSA